MQQNIFRLKRLQVLAIITAIMLLAGFGPARASVMDVNLGFAAEFAVFNMTGKLQMSNSSTTIGGTLAAGNGSTENVSGGMVGGDYLAHTTCTGCDGSSVTFSGSGSFMQDAATDSILEQAAIDVMNAQTAINSLVATQSIITDIDGDTTISRTEQYNVVDLTSISLTGSEQLTLNGNADDYFFVRLDGDLSMTGSSNILLDGGLTAATVIFLVSADMSVGDVTQTGSSMLFGTYLVTGQYKSSGSHLTGAVMAQNLGGAAETIVLTSGATIDYVAFQPVPVPTAIWLFASALGLLGGLSRRK
ncbi:MAG: DUF3494 domain-containing protein [Gammaproteobacteria bacterium]|nr:DUF3494 domain-containing protein [Gammaproteobacteria bacterium]